MSETKATRKVNFINPTFFITTLICLGPLVAGIILWNRLPDNMATHFGFDGKANGFMSKTQAVVFMSLIFLLVNTLMHFATSLEARLNKGLAAVMKWFAPCLAVFVSSITYLYNLGMEMDIVLVAGIFTGLFFVILGNYLPKTPADFIHIGLVPKHFESEEEKIAYDSRKRKIARCMGIGMVAVGLFILATCLTPVRVPCLVAAIVAIIALSFVPIVAIR